MHKTLFCFSLLLLCMTLHAQYAVTFRIDNLPSYHISSDPVFITGSFNNWNPAQKEGQLQKDRNGKHFITFSVPQGRFEFKFTRGGWDKVEVDSIGKQIRNRELEVLGDTIIAVSIMNWSDHFTGKQKKSTAGANVSILDTTFFIPQLNLTRRIWIYLPESYGSSRKKYPVMYMHDGQNVFEDSTSFAGEWGVDEALDTLGPKYKEVIVVAIDNGGDRRMNEYSPFDMERYGKGEGDLYVDFMVKTLMPYINKKYRTVKKGKQTIIAGSSMGGLISLYAMLKYPKKFGKAGVFSPSFWIAPDLEELIRSRSKELKGQIYFFAGQQEGNQMVSDMLTVIQQLNMHSKVKLTAVVRAEGKHDEATWRAQFPSFYKWIIQNQAGK